jgi:MYXO-CTERM domain-containing protein
LEFEQAAATQAPEPATRWIAGFGLTGLALVWRRRRVD